MFARWVVLTLKTGKKIEAVKKVQQEILPVLEKCNGFLGVGDTTSCADLMSYLLFDSKYTRALIEIGYDDASKRIDEIENFLFFSDDRGAETPNRGGVGRNTS
jgi:hypothetical protein